MLRPKDTKVEVVHYVFPEYANPMGTLYGGRMMNWIVTVGTLAASRTSRGNILLGSMDEIDFVKPVRVGDLVALEAVVEYVGEASMEVGVKVTKENPTEGTRVVTNVAHMAFVAVDDYGRPRRIASKVGGFAMDAEEEKIWEAAKRRRAARLERLRDRKEKAKQINHEEELPSWRVENSHVVMPEDAYLGNVMFAGKLLMMVDEISSVLAARYSHGICVTGSVDAVDFYSPMRIGEIITLRAGVNYVGKTSIEIGTKVLAENIPTGEVRHACTSYSTFVHLDFERRPSALPKLTPSTQTERNRWQEAEQRRARRLERIQRLRTELAGMNV